MSTKASLASINEIFLGSTQNEDSQEPDQSRFYGSAQHINAIIGNALLDYLEVIYQSIGINCLHGPIEDGPFHAAQGIYLTSAIGTLNPIMARNLELFLDMVAGDGEAHRRDIHIFRDHSTDRDRRIIVYDDAREMMEYTYLLYKDRGILCDFTRQYDQIVSALKPRNNADGFYLN